MVYVDGLNSRAPRKLSYHMVADSEQELCDFARRLGLRVGWLQHLPVPHFDLSVLFQAKAVRLGAVPLANHDFATVVRSLRTQKEAAHVKQ